MCNKSLNHISEVEKERIRKCIKEDANFYPFPGSMQKWMEEVVRPAIMKEIISHK